MSVVKEEDQENVAEAIRCPLQWVYDLFTAHPLEAGLTYREHFHRAVYAALRMGWGAVALAIHALFPFCFRTTGTRTIRALYEEFEGAATATATLTDKKD
jgi:hypothetical protein